MLSLPSKPWKKVKIDALGGDEYRLTFISPLDDEAQFQAVIDEDIVSSLGPTDKPGTPDWPSRSVTVTIADFAAFKRKLVYASIMIETA